MVELTLLANSLSTLAMYDVWLPKFHKISGTRAVADSRPEVARSENNDKQRMYRTRMVKKTGDMVERFSAGQVRRAFAWMLICLRPSFVSILSFKLRAGR